MKVVKPNKTAKVIQAAPERKKRVDPVVAGMREMTSQLKQLISKKTPAPVVNVTPLAPVVTVKQPEIIFPGPPKRWEFTGTKTGNVWKIVAERIE